MKKGTNINETRFALVSRITFFLSIALFIGATISLMTNMASGLTSSLFVPGAILGLINFITPGILLLLRHPDLAYAWLRGRNPIVYTNVHWDELSSDKRKSVYIDSIFVTIFVTVFLVWFLSEQF